MPATMKALACNSFGPVASLAVMDLPIPEPGPGQIRVRVQATSINPADAKTVTGATTMLHAKVFPLVTGWDYSGEVDALGAGTSGFSKGQAVFSFLPYGGSTRQGALAQFTLVQAAQLAPRPEGVGPDLAAAAATTGITALQALRLAGVRQGSRVLVTGASGGVGSIAVGIARRLGAEVEALTSAAHAGAVAALGASKVWDRGNSEWIHEPGEPFDAILDAAAAYSYGSLRRLLKRGGSYVTTLPKLSFLTDFIPARLRGHRTAMVMVRPVRADLEQLAGWLAEGLAVPIAQRYALAQGAEAMDRAEKGAFFGKLVVTLD
jgi:NADPH:quinone reductase-like Zn-dependent oxidoreductase